ncbi:hypothetical protein [[Clostridium] polysaccharolyticum]|uniref:Uncharacterized protein n=1 Tax=[Clostridium] polysaccharolyticum TaxID=29364 RepID=A0A1I0A7A5_9FIRM|nr:hypothetical protein [[Clostridium] polysaccharolyticum]SES90073.1 hypothetical protein SAMN04487772_1052 [[Clostridium] polysaccharolyticum]
MNIATNMHTINKRIELSCENGVLLPKENMIPKIWKMVFWMPEIVLILLG